MGSGSDPGDGVAEAAAPLSLALPVDAQGLSDARGALASWLERCRVAGEDADDVLIAGNEACMNAVEHSGAEAASKIELSASLEGRRLELAVRDSGSWREPAPSNDRGHGLGLMRSLMDDVEIDRDGHGTRVWMRKDVSFGEATVPARVPGSVTVGEVQGLCVAIMQGEVELASVDRLEEELEKAAGPSVPALLLDLTDVSYLDSSGVHLLFRLARRRHEEGGSTRVVASGGPVRRVLELTGVESMMPVDESVEEAIARIRAARDGA